MLSYKKILKQPGFLGNIAYRVARLLKASLRLKVYKSEHYDENTPYLFAFWHGKQFLPVQQLSEHNTPKIALVSPSKDGDILSAWLKKLDYDVLRGSARDRNIECTIAMLRKLKQGNSLGFGIDGPIGPIHVVKPGMSYLAQKSGVAIIPLGSAFSKKKIFERAWDKYQLPYPFVKAVYYIGDPIIVDKDDNLDNINTQIGTSLEKAEMIAEKLLLQK